MTVAAVPLLAVWDAFNELTTKGMGDDDDRYAHGRVLRQFFGGAHMYTRYMWECKGAVSTYTHTLHTGRNNNDNNNNNHTHTPSPPTPCGEQDMLVPSPCHVIGVLGVCPMPALWIGGTCLGNLQVGPFVACDDASCPQEQGCRPRLHQRCRS